jgi:hypothetical protein
VTAGRGFEYGSEKSAGILVSVGTDFESLEYSVNIATKTYWCSNKINW